MKSLPLFENVLLHVIEQSEPPIRLKALRYAYITTNKIPPHDGEKFEQLLEYLVKLKYITKIKGPEGEMVISLTEKGEDYIGDQWMEYKIGSRNLGSEPYPGYICPTCESSLRINPGNPNNAEDIFCPNGCSVNTRRDIMGNLKIDRRELPEFEDDYF